MIFSRLLWSTATSGCVGYFKALCFSKRHFSYSHLHAVLQPCFSRIFQKANFCLLCYNLLRVWVGTYTRDARDIQGITSERNQRRRPLPSFSCRNKAAFQRNPNYSFVVLCRALLISFPGKQLFIVLSHSVTMATSILGFDPERCQAPASVAVSMGEEDSRHLRRSVLSMTINLLKTKKAFDVLIWKELWKKPTG